MRQPTLDSSHGESPCNMQHMSSCAERSATFHRCPRIETISWKPRGERLDAHAKQTGIAHTLLSLARVAFVYHNFLTASEVDHLVNMGSRRVSDC